MPKGFGLVYRACKLVLRFAGLWYATQKDKYTPAQQAVIDPIIAAANALIAAVDVVQGN